MAWRIFVVTNDQRGPLDELLTNDDLLWRQTRILRDASSMGGPAGELYLYMEGSETAMAHADEKVTKIAKPVEKARGEELHARIKDEEEKSAQGMGLMFSD